MTDQLIIKNLKARGIIGVYEWERTAPQEILVNLALFADLSKVCKNDRIEDSIDYGKVSRIVMDFIANSARYTVEALASDIANLCLGISGVNKVRVRVEKPGAVDYAESVGVEIERSAPETKRS